MIKTLATTALVLLASAVILPAAGSASTSPPVVTAGSGTDLGDGRPDVTYDGLMVRRREAIAIRSTPGTDLRSLRAAMDDAANRRHLSLTGVSPSVLAPVMLEDLAPQLTLLLPPGATPLDAQQVLDTATPTPGLAASGIASVLVHDLRFTVQTRHPSLLAAKVAREGILADALGSYRALGRGHELDITYTGPLLSDPLVAAVRSGIARRAGTVPSAVTISPRTTHGQGVDIAREPPLPPAPDEGETHEHGLGFHAQAVQPGDTTTRQSSPWVLPLVIFLGALIALLTLVQLTAWRRVEPARPDRAARPAPRTSPGRKLPR